MNIFLGIILGLLVLTFLITAHEFGHFIMARRSGVRVKEFGIGFPPRAVCWVRSKPEKGQKKGKWHKISKKDWKKEQNSLIFSLNWLPIGGFCAMDGENDDETRKGTFGSVSFWKKTKILFGGVAMNWLVAFLILTVLCWTGLPEIFDHQFTIKSDETISVDSYVTVAEVKEGSPAETAGFEVGDIISETLDFDPEKPYEAGRRWNFDGKSKYIVVTSQDIISFNSAHANQTVYYIVSRGDEYKTLPVTLNPADSEYLLGITMSSPAVTYRYTWSAPIVAAGLTVQTTAETFKGFGQLIVNLVTGAARQVSSNESVREEGKEQLEDVSNSVSGIVGIIGGYFPNLLTAGFTMIALFTAIISISLACMNVLPIPALDGGRWFMIFLCHLRHKKLSKEREQSIVAKSFIVLLILMAVITVMDIIKLF
ncbi:site-2 protease family protein [Candidatus Saccharibacteria bacterium]|nr:site-2 protease family protein [Candidatus Saccharibacteria bacterium]MBR6123133.1 site-2 protease family protein [Candidatus Saccharibacteria bacterium]